MLLLPKQFYLRKKQANMQQLTPLSEEGNEEKAEEENGLSDDEEVEVEEFKFENKTYYTDDAQNGHLFECLEDGEIGDIVGNLENGSVFFS